MTNLEKRSALQRIIMYSRMAIEKLDNMTYYSNMIDNDDANKEYFQQLLDEATIEFDQVNDKIHVLNESLKS